MPSTSSVGTWSREGLLLLLLFRDDYDDDDYYPRRPNSQKRALSIRKPWDASPAYPISRNAVAPHPLPAKANMGVPYPPRSRTLHNGADRVGADSGRAGGHDAASPPIGNRTVANNRSSPHAHDPLQREQRRNLLVPQMYRTIVEKHTADESKKRPNNSHAWQWIHCSYLTGEGNWNTSAPRSQRA